MLSLFNLLSGSKGKAAEERAAAEMNKRAVLRAGNSCPQNSELATLIEDGELCDDLSKMDYKRAHHEPGGKVRTF
jgi:hypothetical protein